MPYIGWVLNAALFKLYTLFDFQFSLLNLQTRNVHSKFGQNILDGEDNENLQT